jgi:phosphate transport system protein
MNKPHIDQVFDTELRRLRTLIEGMGQRALHMLDDSLEATWLGDVEKATRVVANDRTMNALEVQIDERCLKLLARWQPAASDLRFVAASLKLVTDLERIGDHCVNICQWVQQLDRQGPAGRGIDLPALGQRVRELLASALASLGRQDTVLAGQILEHGAQVDATVKEMVRSCFQSLRDDGLSLQAAVRTHELTGYLQRIAAHATNIAEMVVFLVRGEDVRHLGKRATSDDAQDDEGGDEHGDERGPMLDRSHPR